MACNLPVALNTDTQSVAFRLYNLLIKSTRSLNKTEQIIFPFFPLANYSSSWAARVNLLLSYLNMTHFTAPDTCDVSHQVT